MYRLECAAMSQRPRTAKATGMSEAEVLALPAAVPLGDANRAIGVGRTMGYRLAKQGDYPIPVNRIASSYRCRRVDILKHLGIHAEAEVA